MGELTGYQLGVIGALFLSVASSVSIVIVNKALMSNLGFPFGKISISPFVVTSISSNHQSPLLNGWLLDHHCHSEQLNHYWILPNYFLDTRHIRTIIVLYA